MVGPIRPTNFRGKGKKGKKQNSNGGGRGVVNSRQPLRIVSLGTIVPDRILVTMPYGEMIQRSPASVTDFYTFRLNSTFDPDLTGVGHQPLGRDQLAGVLYNRYRVHGVRITVDFSAYLAANVPVLTYMYLSNGYNLATITDALEQPYCFTKFMGDASYGYSSRQSTSANLWDIWGKTKQEYLADDTTAAAFGASPSEVISLDIGLGSCNRSTNVSEWRFAIKIEYLTEWFDRVLIAAS
jgi:hypothetical protein